MDPAGRRFRWGGRALVAACLCLGALVIGAGPAAGATWTGRYVPGETDRLPLFGISCPTSSLCVSVGGNNTVASSRQPTGPTSAWQVVHPGAGATPLGPNQRQIRGVSCPSPQLCVAVSFEGLIYASTNPTGGGDAWTVTDLDGEGPNTHLYGISCPSASFCAASAGGAKVVTSTNPTGGAAAWTKTQLEAPMELRGISCASPALCVAVGDNGDNIRPEVTDQALLASSASPLSGAWKKAPIPGRQSLFGISCPATTLCVSGDTLGNLLVSTNPDGGSGTWRQIDGGGSVQITDTDCASPSLCVAIDNNADVLTSTNPSGGPGDWTFTNLLPFPGVDETELNAMWGVSCPSRAFCAISGNAGQIFTSVDPFAASERKGDGTGKKGKRGKRPKRPRVKIATSPPPALELSGRKLPARFRFFARGHVQVRGFVCKLDRRPLKRCHSPKIYRVGLGRHVFRVRAIGWTGLRGPVEMARFRVCRPTPHFACQKHLPPSQP